LFEAEKVNFVFNPDSFESADWCSWPEVQIKIQRYVTCRGGNGSLREVSKEKLKQLLQSDIIYAQSKQNEYETTMNSEIEKVKRETASEINEIRKAYPFSTVLNQVLIAPNGDYRADLLHPLFSTRVQRLQEACKLS
jgi:hypothetical protein